MSEFKAAAAAVRRNIDKMAKGELYVVDIDGDTVWEAYLGAFPPGTNGIFRERRHHDCSACRQFIRAMGNVVSIGDGNTLRTIWNVSAPAPYDTVFAALDKLISTAPIKTVLFSPFKKIGVEYNFEEVESGDPLRWDHFSCELPRKFVTPDVRQEQGELEGNVQVIRRGFKEITKGALDTVIDLCENNSLYRGEQHLKTLRAFRLAKKEYAKAKAPVKDKMVWRLCKEVQLKVRNTSIGTLLVDLSEGKDLEKSVAAYEKMVAPANYRRSSSPITKAMIDKALGKVADLGLQDSLARRHATAQDLSVQDVIFVNRSTRSVMRDAMEDLRDSLMAEAPGTFKPHANTETVSMTQFLEELLPGATKVEVLPERQHMGNLVSLTVPVNEGSESLFQWGGGLAWSYRGDATDSIKERVKKAGGSVTGYGRVSLSWGNIDDLDIHVEDPDGNHIYYGDPGRPGQRNLDVDMNAGGRRSTTPVENITWPTKRHFMTGQRRVWVKQYSKRNPLDYGFEVEVEIDGDVWQFSYDKPMNTGVNVPVCTIQTPEVGDSVVTPSGVVKVGAIQNEEWGVKTGELREVEMVVLSPNYWADSGAGNKHWFFILKDCKNPDPVRGIYNEFLRSDLREHRKVFEMVGAKTMCPPSEQQLSGLGFSSTIRNHFVVRIMNGNNTNMYKVEI